MFLRQLFDSDTWTYTYLLADPTTREAALIDPVRDQTDRDLKLVQELGFTLKYAIDTHVHADHVTAAGLLRERSGCKLVCGEKGPESADLRLPGGSHIALGSVQLTILSTPGHTDDSISILAGSDLFTGDALLIRGCGRTDFQNGSAEQLYLSITQRMFSLPDTTRVWPGHDYKGQTSSTIAEEKRHNPRLASKSQAEFVQIMGALGLPPPKYLQQAVPANREVGLGIGPEATMGRFDEIDGAAVKERLGTLRVIDVREPHELLGELGVITGAQNVPMAEVTKAATDWPREQPLLIVCRSGRRSRQVCEQLVAMGFNAVTNLRGGMLDYNERGQAA